jgi:hypothetical protein
MPDLQKVADLLRQVAEELVSGLPEGEEKEAGLNLLGSKKKQSLKKLDDDQRGYLKPPNEKPPRRQKGTPLSETRDYGSGYMEQYRAEGKDNSAYIPKGRK